MIDSGFSTEAKRWPHSQKATGLNPAGCWSFLFPALLGGDCPKPSPSRLYISTMELRLKGFEKWIPSFAACGKIISKIIQLRGELA